MPPDNSASAEIDRLSPNQAQRKRWSAALAQADWNARRDARAALAACRSLLAELQAFDEKLLVAQATRVLATAHFSLQEFAQAEHAALEAVALSRACGDAPGCGMALNTAALVAVFSGDYQEALQRINLGMKEVQAGGSIEVEAWLRNTMGICLNDMGRVNQAIDTMEEAYRLLGARVDSDITSRLASNLGSALAKRALQNQQTSASDRNWKASLDRGIARCHEAIAYRRQVNDVVGISSVLDNLGTAFIALGDYDQAMILLDQAEEILPAYRRDYSLTFICCNRARVWLKRLQPVCALDEIARGLAAATRMGTSTNLDVLYQLQSQAWEAAGDYRAALQSHKQFHASYGHMGGMRAEQMANSLSVVLATDSALRQAREERLRATALEQQIDLLSQQSALFQRQSREESLTGLPNRRHFEERLVDGFGASSPDSSTPPRFALALIDLDHFKHINDQYSHVTGDAILRHVAQVLRTFCRSDDLPARLGGDEFAIVFDNIDAPACVEICERIRLAVDAQPHPLSGVKRVSVSIGIADSGQAQALEALVSAADAALYASKRGGRNRVSVYAPLHAA